MLCRNVSLIYCYYGFTQVLDIYIVIFRLLVDHMLLSKITYFIQVQLNIYDI